VVYFIISIIYINIFRNAYFGILGMYFSFAIAGLGIAGSLTI